MYVCRFFFVPIIRIAVQTGFLYVHVFYRDMMHIAYETVYIHVQYLHTKTVYMHVQYLQTNKNRAAVYLSHFSITEQVQKYTEC